MNVSIEVKVGFGEKKIEDGLLILNLVPTGAEYAGTNVVTFSVTLSSDSETGIMRLPHYE